MAAVVLDCSVTLSWLMPDEGNAQAAEVRTLVTDEGAVVPMLWPIELGNALLFAVRGRRVTTVQRATAIEALGQLPIEIDTKTLAKVWSDTLTLADELRLTLYDACYVELAKRRALPLATLDKELRAAGKKLGIPLLG